MAEVTIEQGLKLAIEHHQAGRLAEAEGIYRQILAQRPNHADALHLLGLIAGRAGRMDLAEELIGKAIGVSPLSVMYYINLGHLLQGTGQGGRAAQWYERAVQANPNSGEAWYELAAALEIKGEGEKALEAYGRVVRLMPGHTLALNNLGMILRSRGRAAEARQCFEQALAVNPNMYEARGNLGVLLESQGRFAEALEQYRVALQVAPDHFMLHYNMGVSLGELDRHGEAVAAYERAIELNPKYPPAHNNLGNVLKFQGRFDEAIASYRRALALEPNLPQAYSNLAAILMSRGELAEALACDRRALELRPEHSLTHGNLCYTMLFLPEFDAAALAAELREWNRRFAMPLREVRPQHVPARGEAGKRLRIGYVSPDLRDHVIARNMLPALRERDRAGFEVFCYSNLVVPDAMTAQLRQLSDHWRDVFSLDDERLAEQIRADGIDILVDLALHMAGNRLMVFARKPAPVQVTFAGYPGSTGMETIDYRLTDGQLEPPGAERMWAEKSLRLASFWCYDPLGVEVPVNALPAAEKGYVTFGCLNHFCKVNEGVLDLWMQVLQAVAGSRLMLLSAEGSHRARTLRHFTERGIAAERIEFAAPRPRAQYLALYLQMDVGLDTVPYNGHTTSLDALWMGVPVVTLVGRTEVGRAGLSQLTNLGMAELITRDPGAFVRVAVELAGDVERLKGYRATLRGRMEKSVLMDGRAFARGIEAAYREMWGIWCAT